VLVAIKKIDLILVASLIATCLYSMRRRIRRTSRVSEIDG